MTAFTTILCATDFSAPARVGVDRAARLARETGAALTLLHVVPGGPLEDLKQWLGPNHPMEQQVHEDVRQRLRQLADEVQATWAPVKVQTMHAFGSVVDEILFEASAAETGLLVVGARGAGLLRRLVLGTTSERLLRKTARPVLVVRRPPDGPYRRALLALDFSPGSKEIVALARQVVPHAHLVLLHVFQLPFHGKALYASADSALVEHYRRASHARALRSMHEFALASGLADKSWEPRILEGEPSQCILEQEQGCDLVVLGKQGRSRTEDLLLGSVTHHVLAEGGTDVLMSTARSD